MLYKTLVGNALLTLKGIIVGPVVTPKLVLNGAAQRLVVTEAPAHLGSLPGGWESHWLEDLADNAAAQVFHAWLKPPLHPGFPNILIFLLYHLLSSAGTVLVIMSQAVRDSETVRPERLPQTSTLIFYNRQTTGLL